MRRVSIVTLTVCLICGLAGIVSADLPTTMSVQGRLSDQSGNPLPAGFKSLTFKIFDAASTGTEIWPNGAGESQFVQTNGDGLWTATIGQSTPLTTDVFSESARWLEITVDDGANPPETLPRVRLATTPYAFQTAYAMTALSADTARFVTDPVPDDDWVVTDSILYSMTGRGIVRGGAGNVHHGDSAHTIVNLGFDCTTGKDIPGVDDAFVTIAGGYSNTAQGDFSTVSGGSGNTSVGVGATVGGGYNNQAVGDFAVVSGGGGIAEADSNKAHGDYATVGGGRRNITSWDYATIGGGFNNEASGYGSVVAGGSYNTASGSSAAALGGSGSQALANITTVCGGNNNRASGIGAAIVGGQYHKAEGSLSFIGSGYFSYTSPSANGSVIGGGYYDTTTGSWATVPGGLGNKAAGRYSLAAGHRAKALHHGCFVWADSMDEDFSSRGPNQFLIRATGGVAINYDSAYAALHIRSTPGDGQEILRLMMERSWTFRQYSTGANTSLELASLTAGDSKNFLISTEGNVGISTLSPAYKLDVQGSIGGTGGLYHASDARFKHNISPITDALGSIERLRGVTFEWQTDQYPDRSFPDGQQIGLIAQEVEDVVPQLVNTAPDGYKSVDYARLVAVLIEAVKEQQSQILEQQSQLDNLLSENSRLSSRLDRLVESRP